MIVDARDPGVADTLEADVVLVGAGPAGLTIARMLSGLDISVLLLESGGPVAEVSAQDLNDGSVEGDAYAGLRTTRHRGIGGTTRLWNTPVRHGPGAKYVPLDESDFDKRPAVAGSGWPFDRSVLLPFYAHAQRMCGLGGFDYDADSSFGAGRVPEFPDGNLIVRVYQFGEARALTTANLGIIRDADNVRLLHGVTVTGLRPAGSRILGLAALTGTGRVLDVRGRTFVLAGGAIENARMLLSAPHDAPWADNAWLGRCFMEHPRDWSMTLESDRADFVESFGIFDTHTRDDGALVAGRIAIAPQALAKDGLPNASVTLLPRLRARHPTARSRGTSGVANAPSTIEGRERRGVVGSVLDALRERGRSRATEGYGWSAGTHAPSAYDAMRLIVNIEQLPHPDNRITLDPVRDRCGVPRARLHWRWRDEDQAKYERVRSLISAGLNEAGLGTVRRSTAAAIDPNAHHHAGTTRMHSDTEGGVVDAQCRVHGCDNLFVAGASVFPTAGFANPTLTIIALAARLAARIRSEAP